MLRRLRRATPAVTSFAALLAMPDLAAACAVCFGGEDTNWSSAFFLGTAVMLVLPPAILIGGGITIYRAIKRQEALLGEREALGGSLPTSDPAPRTPSTARHLHRV